MASEADIGKPPRNRPPHPPLEVMTSVAKTWRYGLMKTPFAVLAIATLALVAPSTAEAKGCLKGAAVGGVAGHMAGHHGVLGAAAGCLYGRHRAKEQDKQEPGQGPPA